MKCSFFLATFYVLCCSVLVSGGVVLSEKSILLGLKSSFSDRSGILSSWNSNHYCSWFGIRCDSKSRVISLNITGGGDDGSSEGNSHALPCSKLSDFPFRGFGITRRCRHGVNGKLAGKLSPLIGKLTELRVLSLPYNELSGEIPLEIWGLKKLELLDLEGNLLSGKFPKEFVGLRKLRVLNLGFNKIDGEIPVSIVSCVSLEVLNLSGNKMRGSVPGIYGSFSRLRELYLAHNELDGSIRDGLLTNCRYLQHIDLSENLFVGGIPPSLGKCLKLRSLLLFSNKLMGSIPGELGRLHKLEVLDISGNNLSGLIPAGLHRFKNLKHVSLADNNLTGVVPSSSGHLRSLEVVNLSLSSHISDCEVPHNSVNSLVRSRRLYSLSLSSSNDTASPSGGTTKAYGFTTIEIASIVSASAIVSVLLALIFLFFFSRKWFPNSRVQVCESKEISVFIDIGVPLTYDHIVHATGNFNASNCIGSGGFGSTYKAEISPGTLVAVKRLAVGRFQGVQQFDNEIKALGSVRHPNLVTLIGYHASETEMFLIYNYLPEGSLENFIRERSQRAVDWKIIHKIALDIARALAHLHDQCAPRVLHRDVKPSNILLDNDFNAYLSDFGLSRLLETSETHATTGVAGTFGYVAPEYALTCRVSEKADVYSYGVVLLELISDKKALDPSFSSHENGFNIVSWACMLLQHGQAKKAFTVGLWDAGPHEHLVEILHLAITCTADSLSGRPTMKHVVRRLERIQPDS
ncbi:hypothetical protein HS088_TW07G01346 [Tripterygium wilfordii]|uniref:non-specific serine/threonine protein kinase n=1 Tax=Tripterygium wilfordii TaxID=458696 RepID=A0A7J7DHG4_TRIWF|nr:LRR receptor-like serine/threonine-protein kinase RPK2 [Tripterygium wilfordii]KAF5745753.1 hypothetical protein HS088_TW07G01346 [Tripterygium wilfordii]